MMCGRTNRVGGSVAEALGRKIFGDGSRRQLADEIKDDKETGYLSVEQFYGEQENLCL